jgi:hypothetical protein
MIRITGELLPPVARMPSADYLNGSGNLAIFAAILSRLGEQGGFFVCLVVVYHFTS